MKLKQRLDKYLVYRLLGTTQVIVFDVANIAVFVFVIFVVSVVEVGSGWIFLSLLKRAGNFLVQLKLAFAFSLLTFLFLKDKL